MLFIAGHVVVQSCLENGAREREGGMVSSVSYKRYLEHSCQPFDAAGRLGVGGESYSIKSIDATGLPSVNKRISGKAHTESFQHLYNSNISA